MTPLHVVILAAGQGRRMRSSLPKVLHLLAGRPLLSYVVEAANALGAARVHVVHGHGGGIVREAMVAADVDWVEQRDQLGTGHAVVLAMAGIPDDATVLVLYGDVPLVNRTTLHDTATLASDSGIALVTAVVADPSGYGRIVRGPDGQVRGIVEEGDADDEQRGIAEINTGILAAHAGRLRGWLRRGSGRDNAQGEHYLTDVIACAVEDGLSVRTVPPEAIEEVLGVNDRAQLAALERFQQRRLAEGLMRDGASLADPARVDIRGRVRTGSDVFVDVNVVFEGEVVLGDRVNIGPGCVIKDTVIEHDTEVRAHCVIEGAQIGVACRIGPFARLRPAARLSRKARIGNFVEVKNATVGEGSKASHLTYIGDSRIGRDVNVGAGVVTCNYDGARKHETVIGDNAFIGSGVMLVAPVTVHAGATIGAGSTIGKDAPADALTVSRAPQRTIEGWKRPRKE